MRKICITLVTSLVMSVLVSGNAYAVKDTQNCVAPPKLLGPTMGPLIESPKDFLRASVKDTHTVRNFKTVKSQDLSEGYFVAGEIVETSTNKKRGIGVWFAPDGYAMLGPASEYSTLMSVKIGRTTWSDSGNGYKIKKTVSKKSHGYAEVLTCFK